VGNAMLYITSRNVAEPGGEWSLIANRASALREVAGITTSILALTRASRLRTAEQPKIPEGVHMRHFPYQSLWHMPGALIRMVCEARGLLASGAFGSVVVSGTPAELIAPLVGSMASITLLVDMHGVIEEWVEYPAKLVGYPLIRKLLVDLFKRIRRRAVHRSGAILSVSHQLSEYCRTEFAERPTFVIPCGVTVRLDKQDILKARAEWRQRLGLGSATVVAYSGGLSRWQMLGQTCAFYKEFSKRHRDSKLLLLTPDPASALETAANAGVRLEEVICLTLPPEEVVWALTAADVGMLLRERSLTNEVAFPNKFSEYVAAGLIVVTSRALVTPMTIASSYGIGLCVDPAFGYEDSIRQLERLLLQRSVDSDSYLDSCMRTVDDRLYLPRQVHELAHFLNQRSLLGRTPYEAR